MIVWGGVVPGQDEVNTGGVFDPVANTSTSTSTGTNVPSLRTWHTAVWSGTRMIVWGEQDDGVSVSTGGEYDPVSDTWISTSTGLGAQRRGTGTWRSGPGHG